MFPTQPPQQSQDLQISATGALTPLGGTVVGENPEGATNLDIAISSDGKFLYTLNSGNGTIGIFAIQKDGSLINVGTAGRHRSDFRVQRNRG